ncbi:hypothetical protein BWI17_17870 [Betaproteobacteria bacterium GR16-43]|nr:hypothetical protein BWI17_17870 [Betaproteobacteria bacterium GR16-43]
MTEPVSSNPYAAFNTRPAAQVNANDASADRFLTLLVTQMKNQDPLNPMDNAQVTSQMAQINTVKGLDKLNDSFNAIAVQLQAGQSMQAAGLVGKEVLVPGNVLALDASGASRGSVSLNTRADQVGVVVKDAAGAVVRRIELGKQEAGIADFEWDGKDDSGKAMPAGRYTFEAVATANGAASAATTLERANVTALTRTNSGFMLTLAGLGEAPLTDVLRIR